MRGSVYVVKISQDIRDAKGIYPASVIVATHTKHCDSPNALRIWARGEIGARSLNEDQREAYTWSAYHRALDYILHRSTPATYSASWALETWDGVQVIGRFTFDAHHNPIITYAEEDLPPTLPLSDEEENDRIIKAPSGDDGDVGDAGDAGDAYVPDDEPLPPFNSESANAWLKRNLTEEPEEPSTPVRSTAALPDDIPVEGKHAQSKRVRRDE